MEKIIEKANYCLGCKVKPCSKKGCPLNNDIPEFIKCIKEENYIEAFKILSKTTVLQGICGRICPHFKQCQGSCVRGIKGNPVSIGELEAFVFDKATKQGLTLVECYKDEIEQNKVNNSKKVAIIGGGPAGLTCAAFLAKAGIKVTIYEKYNYLGGLLIHGIPEFRLPKEIVKKTVQMILDLGVEVKYNTELNKDITLQELENQYDAIFLSFGANKSSKMGVQGEELNGVYGGNELLEYKLHPNYEGKTVAVVGGGNVAMDCARTVKKLGAKEVKVIYRRSREEMPAENKEIEDAINEGIEFLYQNNIVKIIGTTYNDKIEKLQDNNSASEKNKDRVSKVELIKTELIQKEGETRKVPVNIEGSNYIIDCDYIIMALGSKPEQFVQNLGLNLNKWGFIEVNEKGQTSNPKIFAGGDIAGVKSTVAWAARSGRDTSEHIIEFLN
ncbi:MAG: NAD(P)-dependent oxidoreductase [Clostridia bacterium]|nr:NAD(P)-dependent oxidoreductase [Clostridia bacterium]